jgi:hypothetical protein
MQDPRDELIDSIEATLKELAPGLGTPRAVAGVIVDGWSVERKAVPLRTEAQEGDPDVYLSVALPGRPYTDAERSEMNARHAVHVWTAYPDEQPPLGVTPLDLLGQRKWWVSKDGTAHEIRAMHTTHLTNTLALLERSAQKLHLSYASRYLMNAPDEVFDAYDRETPDQWLRAQPLIKRMRKELKLRERLRKLDTE